MLPPADELFGAADPLAPLAGRDPNVYIPPLVPHRPPRRKVLLPVVLYVLTCCSTYLAGGPAYCGALMLTLTAHEFGHFLQAVRYHVPASLPFFIPLPLPPIGTMGAVIVTLPGRGNRKELFDIAITGPLAGLIPALLFCIVGLQWSEVAVVPENQFGFQLGEPLLFQGLAYLIVGPIPEGHDIFLHPVGFAGWVGIFITALNLMPIGQLDGGHILYVLLGKGAHRVARTLLVAGMVAIVVGGYWGWIVWIFLLTMIGVKHPPTADDTVPIGAGRTILGWAALCFVPLGFTPVPFDI